MSSRQFAQRRNDEMADRRGERRNRHRAAQPAIQLGQLSAGLGEFLFDALGAGGQQLAGRCEARRPARAIDQRLADFPLELRKLLGDRGPGGGGDRAP